MASRNFGVGAGNFRHQKILEIGLDFLSHINYYLIVPQKVGDEECRHAQAGLKPKNLRQSR